MPAHASAADQDRWIFIKAATWPDMIRPATPPQPDHPLTAEFHKGDWHFINLPYKPPGDTITLPPNPVPTPAGMEPKDVISAIALCSADVKATGTSKRLRAARLCFLLHTVGDVHQPLHASAMFSDDKLKHGDQGGNLVLVRRPGQGGNADQVLAIHQIFDGLLGRDTRLSHIKDKGELLEHAPETTRAVLAIQVAVTDPTEWAKESLADAIQFAYLDGTIQAFRGKTVKQFFKDHEDVDSVPLEKGNYESNAWPVADKRVALAGYRLADVLAKVLP
jgi:hypothetical protein